MSCPLEFENVFLSLYCFFAYLCFFRFFTLVLYWLVNTLSISSGSDDLAQRFADGGNSTGFEPDLPSRLPKKQKNSSKVNRVDESEVESNYFGGIEPKPCSSLLNQLAPGQVFDPRNIDFSALTLPNSHKSSKNKKRWITV